MLAAYILLPSSDRRNQGGHTLNACMPDKLGTFQLALTVPHGAKANSPDLQKKGMSWGVLETCTIVEDGPDSVMWERDK
jgi:hypothetical protein